MICILPIKNFKVGNPHYIDGTQFRIGEDTSGYCIYFTVLPLQENKGGLLIKQVCVIMSIYFWIDITQIKNKDVFL